jgi:hypothetical protein
MAVFICFAKKQCNMYQSSSIGAFIESLRRSMAKHDKCAYIYSENEMSFILAQKEI